jgi:bacterioferritin
VAAPHRAARLLTFDLPDPHTALRKYDLDRLARGRVHELEPAVLQSGVFFAPWPCLETTLPERTEARMLELVSGRNRKPENRYAEQGEAAMRGDEKVIAALNAGLKEELKAINQYFIHAEMCENWGYKKLSGYIKKQSIDEMKHAEALIERILFLDGSPKLGESMTLTVGQSVKAQIESDLKLEIGAVAMYNASAKLAAEGGDHGSRDLFVRLLKDEESHVDWLEAQLSQIKELGAENYLAQQL